MGYGGALRLGLGTNVFELVQFTLVRRLTGGLERKGIYGVNVEKVREVVRMPSINPLASRHPAIAGIFELRGVPIPAVNLGKVLGDEDSPLGSDHQIVVTEFSHKRAGFIVSNTNRIRRISWEKVLPPASDSGACISGMTLIEENEFLFILDLEKILMDIEGAPPEGQRDTNGFAADPVAAGLALPILRAPRGASLTTVLLVDDSSLILNSARIVLERSGYHVLVARNGSEAVRVLEGYRTKPNELAAVITDVEMPKMDGLTLTRWIRSQVELASVPVILHTSLSGHNTQEAGLSAGANGYVVKNNAKQLLELLKEVVGGSR